MIREQNPYGDFMPIMESMCRDGYLKWEVIAESQKLLALRPGGCTGGRTGGYNNRRDNRRGESARRSMMMKMTTVARAMAIIIMRSQSSRSGA